MGEIRDMMYGGFCQNTPGAMAYGNYNYQLPPGALLNNNMMMGPNLNGFSDQNQMYDNNPLIDINARLNNLENKVKTIEQKIQSNSSGYQDDNSMYML